VNTELLILFVLLQIADIYTTHTVLKQGGRELNPVLASLFTKANPIVVMVTLKLLAVWALWYVNMWGLTAASCAVYAWVVISNWREINK
jgi:hypothetical protein